MSYSMTRGMVLYWGERSTGVKVIVTTCSLTGIQKGSMAPGTFMTLKPYNMSSADIGPIPYYFGAKGTHMYKDVSDTEGPIVLVYEEDEQALKIVRIRDKYNSVHLNREIIDKFLPHSEAQTKAFIEFAKSVNASKSPVHVDALFP